MMAASNSDMSLKDIFHECDMAMNCTDRRLPSGDPTPLACGSGSGSQFAERGGKWILGNYENTLYDHYYPPNGSILDCMNIQQQKSLMAARSDHPNGINAAYCDGSVRFEANDLSPEIWRAAGTQNHAD